MAKESLIVQSINGIVSLEEDAKEKNIKRERRHY